MSELDCETEQKAILKREELQKSDYTASVYILPPEKGYVLYAKYLSPLRSCDCKELTLVIDYDVQNIRERNRASEAKGYEFYKSRAKLQ